ncbi:MAG: acireductone synthase [Polyangiaceae bacterium]|jgi:enolase-phosphatase E1
MPAILTDIEGTTSSLSFVKDVLFPFARRHIPNYVRAHRGDPGLAAILESVRVHEREPMLDEESVVAVLGRWIDEDRKAAPLKTLQGYVWAEGYRTGAFQGHVYADAVTQLRAWHARGFPLYVFSSGSVAAQRLLFAHTAYGDLTPLFAGFFDTNTGAKRDSASYTRIASEIRMAAGSVLFLSDTESELDAAREAGMATIRLDRERVTPGSKGHPLARDFNEVDVWLSRWIIEGERASLPPEPPGAVAPIDMP